jgi:hypothetical protein
MEDENPQPIEESFLIYSHKYLDYVNRSEDRALFVIKGTEDDVRSITQELEQHAKWEGNMKQTDELCIRRLQVFESVDHFKRIRQERCEKMLEREMMRSASCSFLRM